MLIGIMNDHGLEQLVHFPTREKIHWIYYSLLSLVSFRIFTHRTNSVIMIFVAGTLKVVIHPIKIPRRKVYLYQKGDYECMRKDAFEFAKEKYFNGYPEFQWLSRYKRTLT